MADHDADQPLIERLQAGDTTALGPLMDRHASRIYRVAHGITRNEADAEEVVQDVFLTLARKIERFEGRAAFTSWLYRVTANAALMKRRGKRAQVEVSIEDYLPAFVPDGHRAGDRTYVLTDWSRSPEEELLNRETGAILRDAIDGLPDHYRAVFVLRDVEGLTNEAAAAALGESVAATKSRLHRARMILRERITRHLAAR
jgi:RNA polymerase sigma-70 factor (ECF subfamily)